MLNSAVKAIVSVLMTVPVTVYNGKKKVTTRAMVDLGANMTFVTPKLASRLGLETSFGGFAQGAGGGLMMSKAACAVRARSGPLLTGTFAVCDIALLGLMPGVDVVLGIDYLKQGKALIDAAKKTVTFRNRKPAKHEMVLFTMDELAEFALKGVDDGLTSAGEALTRSEAGSGA